MWPGSLFPASRLSSPISGFESLPSPTGARVNKLSIRVVEMLMFDRRQVPGAEIGKGPFWGQGRGWEFSLFCSMQLPLSKASCCCILQRSTVLRKIGCFLNCPNRGSLCWDWGVHLGAARSEDIKQAGTALGNEAGHCLSQTG